MLNVTVRVSKKPYGKGTCRVRVRVEVGVRVSKKPYGNDKGKCKGLTETVW